MYRLYHQRIHTHLGITIHVPRTGRKRWCKMDEVWQAARAWGKEQGLEVQSGVVQGAPPL